MRRAVPSIWHGRTGAGHTRRLPPAVTPPAVRRSSKAAVALASCRRCRRPIERSPMRNGAVFDRSYRRRGRRQDDRDTITARCSMASWRWWAPTCRGGRCRRNTASGTGRTSGIGCGVSKGSGSASSTPWQTQSAKCPCRAPFWHCPSARFSGVLNFCAAPFPSLDGALARRSAPSCVGTVTGGRSPPPGRGWRRSRHPARRAG